MSKKKSSGNNYKNEEEAYYGLISNMEKWKKNRTTQYLRPPFLKSVKMEFRSARICEIIFSNDDIFDVNKEIPYIPLDIMSEDNLIRWIYEFPSLVCNVDRMDREKEVYIPEEKITLPVYVAFELGKRRCEKVSAIMYGTSGAKYPYPKKALEYRKTLIAIADEIEELFGNDFFEQSFSLKDDKEKSAFIQKIVDLSKEKSNIDSVQPDVRYEPKYQEYDYILKEKLLILISGYADSGKKIFSKYLANTINGAYCFDSDQLLERGWLNKKLSQLINPEKNVVIFSDLDAFLFFRPEEIKEAMGDANVLKIYIKPSSTKRMLQHSKYRQSEDIDSYTAHYERFHNNNNSGMDITITNDYTSDSMLKGCDEVIDMINKLFGNQEVAKTSPRKSANDLLSELGAERIEEGATRAKKCELFKPPIERNLEK